MGMKLLDTWSIEVRQGDQPMIATGPIHPGPPEIDRMTDAKWLTTVVEMGQHRQKFHVQVALNWREHMQFDRMYIQKRRHTARRIGPHAPHISGRILKDAEAGW